MYGFYLFLKGIPMIFYGVTAIFLIKHKEYVHMENGKRIPIYFLYEEDKGSHY